MYNILKERAIKLRKRLNTKRGAKSQMIETKTTSKEIEFFDNFIFDDNNSVNLKTRKKEWPKNIPIDFSQTNNIKNKKNCPADELIVWKNHELHYSYLKSVDEDKRDKIAKDLLNYFMSYNWDKIRYDKEQVEKDWENLKNIKTKITKRGKGIFIDNVSASGTKIYKYFFPNVLKVSSKGKISVYDALNDKEFLWKIIRNRMGNTLLYNTKNREARQWPMSIRPAMILQGAKCSGFSSVGSIFKPIVAKTIYERWVKNGDNVYDFSCGFGTRLLGLMSAGIKDVKYYGCEPNSETYDNLIKMSKYFGFNVDIRKRGSEDVIFKDKMGFVFSSPPYFNYESYCNEKTQCYNRYPDYEKWLERYWRKTVKNIKKMLKKNGVFAVNIGGLANPEMVRIAEDFKRIIKEEGFKLKETWWMRTSRSHLTNKKKTGVLFKQEGIYFYGH